MNWNNLQQNNCPNCNKKLSFRLSNSKNKIRSRLGKTLGKSDYYFCFRCDFQIRAEKLLSIAKNANKELAELTKDCKYL